MSTPKPSDLPHQSLHAVRHSDPLTTSLGEIDECMTEFLGADWREDISPADAVTLTDVALANIVEEP